MEINIKRCYVQARDNLKADLHIGRSGRACWATSRVHARTVVPALGPKIWNNLPIHLKCSDNLISFKEMIKNWDGRNCKCNICNAHISRI